MLSGVFATVRKHLVLKVKQSIVDTSPESSCLVFEFGSRSNEQSSYSLTIRMAYYLVVLSIPSRYNV